MASRSPRLSRFEQLAFESLQLVHVPILACLAKLGEGWASVRECRPRSRQLALTPVREGPGQLVLREIEDRDLGVLFEHWSDPDAIRMAAFTSPEADDRTSFEQRWARLRSDVSTTNRVVELDGRVVGHIASFDRRVTARSPIGSAVRIGVAALPRVPYRSSCSWTVRFTLALRATTPRRFVCIADSRSWARGGAHGRGEETDEVVLRLDAYHRERTHFRWHQKHEHPQRAGRPPGQTDCRVQRPLHSHRDARPPGTRHGMAVHQRTRTQNPMCELGWKSLGVLELTALPSIDEELWVPMVQETDVLLVNGGDPLYLCYWMRQSGLADLLPSLRAVYVGLSAGSMVMAPNIGEDFVHWKPPTGGDETLGLVDFFDLSAPGSRGSAGEHHGRRRKMGRRHAGAGVRDRRSDRHQSDRRHRRSRLRGALEAVHAPTRVPRGVGCQPICSAAR